MKTEMKETEKELEGNMKTEEDISGESGSAEEEKSEIAQAEADDKSEETAKDGKKAARSMVSTRNGLYLRTVIGGLILYYAYTILSDMGTASGRSRTMLYIFVAVFGVAGIWIILDSLKRLFKKEYDE